MRMLLAVIQHTPIWVFAVGALLLVTGIRSLRPRNVAVARILLVPAVFMVWGLASLLLRSVEAPLLVVDWLVCCAVGAAIGWQTTRLNGVQINPAGSRVTLPGRRLPLIRNMTIFAAKYALGVAAVLAPAWRGEIALWDIGVSGLSEGYFIAWLLQFALFYRAAMRRPAAVPAE